MTDRGLNSRLRQRSRRAGVMIGVSMAITIALCVAGFSVIYSALDPFTSDFVSNEDPTVEATLESQASNQDPTAEPTGAPEDSQEQSPTEPPADDPAGETAPTATTESESGDNQIEPEDDDGEFTPDYQISAGQNVNLRSGPGTDTEPVTSLTSEQALQYLGESQPSDNPGRDGLSEDQVWMQFRTEDGEEGWVRELDVEPYDPDA
jgi:cytoskeletal protein RodZ